MFTKRITPHAKKYNDTAKYIRIVMRTVDFTARFRYNVCVRMCRVFGVRR